MAIDLSGYEKGNPRKRVIATSLKENEMYLVQDLTDLLNLKNTADLLRYCINATIKYDPNVLGRFTELDEEAQEEYFAINAALRETYMEIKEPFLVIDNKNDTNSAVD